MKIDYVSSLHLCIGNISLDRLRRIEPKGWALVAEGPWLNLEELNIGKKY
jgi:hypothetical protein